MERAVTGGHTASGGPFSAAAASLLRDRIGAQSVLLTTSCTDALEMTALLDSTPGLSQIGEVTGVDGRVAALFEVDTCVLSNTC